MTLHTVDNTRVYVAPELAAAQIEIVLIIRVSMHATYTLNVTLYNATKVAHSMRNRVL